MEITKSELEQLYRTKKNKEVCEILGITPPTLGNYIKKMKIKQKGKGSTNTKVTIKEG